MVNIADFYRVMTDFRSVMYYSRNKNEIRKKMKEIDPELFSQYMKCIKNRKSHRG